MPYSSSKTKAVRYNAALHLQLNLPKNGNLTSPFMVNVQFTFKIFFLLPYNKSVDIDR